MILIYTPVNSPRFEYISRLIFDGILGIKAAITTDKTAFLNSENPRLNYSDSAFNNLPFIKSSGFLFSTTISIPALKPVICEDTTGFFETSPDSILPFDPFAASFLLVSRMEEYLPAPRDIHGRFEAKSSLLYQFDLLEKPLVNIWTQILGKILLKLYPQLVFPEKEFKISTTIDIDNAWAYRNKGFLRTTGAFMKDFLRADLHTINQRIRVLTGKLPDPYDTYGYMLSSLDGQNETVIFVHTGNYGRFDKPVSWKNAEFKALIQKLAGKFTIGAHPSYKSSENNDTDLVTLEKQRLEFITMRKISHSRQHFLKLTFPETYQRLIEAGISSDYTMGFHDKVGFRAGTCTPFKFYDLTKEQETKLTIFPFQVMDVTLRQYMKLTPTGSIKKIKSLITEIEKVNGTFSSFWHNESLSESGIWKGYREVFEFINNKARENRQD